jgi:hypothetical protein
VHQPDAVPFEEPGAQQRRPDELGQGLPVVALGPVSGQLPQRLDLVRLRRDGEHARQLQFGLDAVAFDVRDEPLEVLRREGLKGPELAGEAPPAVLLAVVQCRFGEPAVAAAGGPADASGLHEHHVAAGVRLLGQEGRPQPAVPAAHDEEVGLMVADELGFRLGTGGVLEPEGSGRGVVDGPTQDPRVQSQVGVVRGSCRHGVAPRPSGHAG